MQIFKYKNAQTPKRQWQTAKANGKLANVDIIFITPKWLNVNNPDSHRE
jgi:hypothetical protein